MSTERPAKLLGQVSVRLADRAVKDVIDCVQRGPVPRLTDVQKTQLQVIVGMAIRQAAANGRWCERRIQDLKDNIAAEVLAVEVEPADFPQQRHPKIIMQPVRIANENPHFDDDKTTEPIRR